MKQFLIHTLIILFSLFYIFFAPTDPVLLNIIFKVIPMLIIIFLAIRTKYPFSKKYKSLIIIGLIVSMIADAVLYWFLIGLSTFFIAHLFYIAAFHHAKQKRTFRFPSIILFLYSMVMAILLVSAQIEQNELILSIAIVSYIGIIFFMGWKALRTKLPLAIIGALLFILSDSILAIHRFIEAVPYHDALVMIPYYSAQLFLAKSIGTRVVKYSVNPKNLIK